MIRFALGLPPAWWYAIMSLTVAACTSASVERQEHPADLAPFRDSSMFKVSADRGTLVGSGNANWLKRIDEIVVWRLPGLLEVAREQIRLQDLQFKGGQTRPSIAVASKGQALAYNDQLDSLVIHDLEGESAVKRFSFSPSWVRNIEFRDDDRQLALILSSPIRSDSPGSQLELVLLDIESGRRQTRPLGREYRWLSSRSNAQRAKFRSEHPSEALGMVTLSPSGDFLAFFRVPAGELSGQVEVWAIDAWQPKLTANFPFGLGTLLFSDNDKLLALLSTAAYSRHGTDSNRLRVIDIPRNEVILEAESVGVPNHSYAAAFSPDGSQLATGTRCHGIQLWDLKAQARFAHASFGGCRAADRITGLAYSRDGQSLYIISEGGELRSVAMNRIVNAPQAE